MIRSGSEKATVSGVFELEDEDRLRQKFGESGLEFNPEELIVKRELSQSGKGRAFVNSQVVPVSFLRDTARFLVDIHGQSEQQTLNQSESQLAFVDAFADAVLLLTEVRELYRHWQDVLKRDRSPAKERPRAAQRYRLADISTQRNREGQSEGSRGRRRAGIGTCSISQCRQVVPIVKPVLRRTVRS